MSTDDNDVIQTPSATDTGSVVDNEDSIHDEEDDPLPDMSTGGATETNIGEVIYPESGKNIFQARVFAEQNNNVYGAEIILFSSETEQPIERILITDVTDFSRLFALVENLQKATVPYTSGDLVNITTISEYLSDRNNQDKKDAYDSITWSKLSEKGSLEAILDNGSGLTKEDKKDYLDILDRVVINATHLNGFTDKDFSQAGHTHNYLSNSHLNTVGSDTERGHVKIVDNLSSTESMGAALSANQGNVLNNKISKLEQDTNDWVTVTTKEPAYITLRVNKNLRLCVCDYNRNDYTGFKKKKGNNQLHKKGTIPSPYPPSTRVVAPVYNGTVTLMFEKDGSVNVYNPVFHDKWNFHVQVMWYY